MKPTPQPKPELWQYQDRMGNWHCFIDDEHMKSTLADGTWPVRALYLHPPPSAERFRRKLK